MNDAPNPVVPSPGFLLQLTNHQSAMYAAVVSMMGRAEGAQDVLQETNAALLEKAKEYDPGKPFIAWAIGFARMQVLAWRKKQTRDRLVLDVWTSCHILHGNWLQLGTCGESLCKQLLIDRVDR
jgi:DNA-directed RNA polymerase specialized sigma24 family protein